MCPAASPIGWSAGQGLRESVLVILQGVWSYWSDVLAVGQVSWCRRHSVTRLSPTPAPRVAQVSWAHPIDRASAVALTGFQLFKLLFLMLPTMSWPEVLWLAGGLAAGIYFKVADYYALFEGNALRYRRSHTLWHVCLPFAFTAHTLARWYNVRDVC